jgi:hypothetical protein
MVMLERERAGRGNASAPVEHSGYFCLVYSGHGESAAIFLTGFRRYQSPLLSEVEGLYHSCHTSAGATL